MWKLELASLEVHSMYYKDSSETVPPSIEEREYALYVIEQAYKSVRSHLPPDFLEYSHFQRVLYRLDRQSSPGYPFCSAATTIGDWLKFDGTLYDDYQCKKLWFNVNQLIDGDAEDVIFSVFIKDEAHKPQKLEQKRCRLIVASPLHFQVLWHMLFDVLNDAEIEKCLEIPSQQGISLSNGNWKLFYNLWKSRGYDVGLDKTAWDWTVTGWKLDMDLEIRNRLTCGPRKQEWYRLSRLMYDKAFKDPILMLSNGLLFRQLYPGIMKSGLVNTISTNSHLQVVDHIIVCKRNGFPIHPLPVTCGDDTLQREEQVDVVEYRKLGAVIKSASSGLEFVGHDFADSGPIPLYLDKHLYNVCHLENNEELITQYLDAMCRLYVNSPVYVVWERLAGLLGIEHSLMSHSYYWYWYHYNSG
ncbi:MAG: hypothetical protein [Ixodes ricinus sobemo-like virus 1]|nr:MAG: hypothetical protein [Ixodes ricinus sobemo-like virus 1]